MSFQKGQYGIETARKRYHNTGKDDQVAAPFLFRHDGYRQACRRLTLTSSVYRPIISPCADNMPFMDFSSAVFGRVWAEVQHGNPRA